MLKWREIDNNGKTQLSRNSYYWVFLIPILANLFRHIKRNATFKFQEQVFEFDLAFPFSWYYLFAIGLLFMVSNILYNIFCPHLIKEFKNYSEFKESGYPMSYLLEQAKEFNVDKADFEMLQRNSPKAQRMKTIKGEGIVPLDEVNFNFETAKREFFGKIYDKANYSKYAIRIISSILIFGSYALIAIIIYQNIETVFDLYNSSK